MSGTQLLNNTSETQPLNNMHDISANNSRNDVSTAIASITTPAKRKNSNIPNAPSSNKKCKEFAIRQS